MTERKTRRPRQGRDATTSDVTELKRAEQALRGSEERFRQLSDAAFEGIVIHDRGRLLEVSRAFAGMFGYDVSELTGMRVLDIAMPECRDMVMQRIISGYEEPFEAVGLGKDGSTFPLEVRGKATSYQGCTVRVAALRDLTQRKQAEKALRESEEKYRGLLQASMDGIAITEGLETKFVNRAFLRLIGFRSEDEIVGRPFTDFVAPDHRELVVERARLRSMGQPVPDRYELRALRADGTELPIEVSVTMTTWEGRPAAQVILRDITDRKREEESRVRFRDELEGRVERQMLRKNPYGLTFRELTILHLVAVGKSDREVAAELGISPLTARTHVGHILEKMNAASRTEARVRAVREGLLD